jgi:hypothetical protein
VGDHDTLATKSTYRSLSAQWLSERTVVRITDGLMDHRQIGKESVPVNCAFLGYCTASRGNLFRNFMRNHHNSLCNNPEERSYQLLGRGAVKLDQRALYYCFVVIIWLICIAICLFLTCVTLIVYITQVRTLVLRILYTHVHTCTHMLFKLSFSLGDLQRRKLFSLSFDLF